MTDDTPKYTRRTQSLPTAAGIGLLVRWVNEGPGSLAPASRGPGGYDPRTKTTHLLRRVAMGLEVPEEERKELRPVHGRDFSRLSDELLNSLAWRARARGYLMPGGRSAAPLTPVQVDTLYRVAWGSSYEDIAKDVGVSSVSASNNMRRAKDVHGCSTVNHLVATAYRNRWLPEKEELRILLSGRMVWDLGRPGYTRPPYKGIV